MQPSVNEQSVSALANELISRGAGLYDSFLQRFGPLDGKQLNPNDRPQSQMRLRDCREWNGDR